MTGPNKAAGSRSVLSDFSLERFATSMRADFRFAPLNVLILIAIFAAGLVTHLVIYGFNEHAVVWFLGSAVVLAGLFKMTQVWEAVVILTTADCLLVYLDMRPDHHVLLYTIVLAVFVSTSFQIAYQWERAVVLRFGRFKALRKSGVFGLVPVIDKVAQFVDQRIRVTDFSAETTLTADTVPVSVDAIAFWMVWDAQKSVLEVEKFQDAVILSAQTALRNAIGQNDLATLLSERDRLGAEIQKLLHEKTTAWGITTQDVEIRDIIIPKALEDAMSRQAQAERERQSRIILGTAETEIAEKFAKASEHYKDNPVALHLRAMNMVYEGLRQKGSMIIVPSSAVETMGLGALGGLTAFGRDAGGQLPKDDSGPAVPPPPPTEESAA
jgi:regulator of protease activity HflC (stomatin/prohibitin superfamily)